MMHMLTGAALARFLAASLLLAAVGSRAAQQNQYVTAEDVRVAGDANNAAIEYCTGQVETSAKTADAREDLLASLGGENVFLEAARNATDMDEVLTNLEDGNAAGFVLSNMLPVTLSLLVLVSFAICCWTSCPLLKCLRCCARERKTHFIWKAVGALMVLVAGVGIVVSVALASRGYSTAVDGVSGVACTSAEMLNTTLQGKTSEPSFIGMLPALDELHKLETALDNNSEFMTGLNVILDRTFDVSKAVVLSSETLRLLKAMMELPANKDPKDTYGNSMMHTCDFCEQIATPLGSAATALEEGAGSAMSSAREEVDKQLTPEARQELQGQMSNGISQMATLKDQFRDTFKVFVEPGKYDKLQETLKGDMQGAVLVLFLFAFLLFGCACCSASCFTVREKPGRPSGSNPYSKSVHRCACCSWWFGFLYAVIALLLGGLLMGFSVPASGACLTLDDLDKHMVRDLAPLMDLDLNGDQGTMLLDMVDNCINPSNPGNVTKDNMLKIVFQKNETSGEKTSLYESIVTLVSDPINAQFDAMTATFGAGVSLGDSAEIANLRSLFAQNPIDSLMIADRTAMTENATLNKLALDTRGDSGVAVGFGTSAACADHVVQGDMGDLAGQTIPGVDVFVAKLTSGSYGPVTGSCASARSDCSSLAGNDAEVCEAANLYLHMKDVLMNSLATFRCDLFEDPADPSQYCDPKDATQDPTGTWIDTCQKSDGTLTVKEKTCTLAEFTTYVTGYDERIRKTMANLDQVVADKKTIVDVDLRNHVVDGLVGPIINVADGITCGWLPAYYQSMIDGLCFQGVWGLRKIGQAYVASGVFILMLIVVMYAVWRRSIDNVNKWTPEAEGAPWGAAPVVV